MANFTVSLKKLTEKVSMDVVYAPQDLENISVEIAEVNRPGLFLAGYYDYFDKLRLQIMGLAEMNFLSGLSPEKRYEALDQLFRQQPQQQLRMRRLSRPAYGHVADCNGRHLGPDALAQPLVVEGVPYFQRGPVGSQQHFVYRVHLLYI